MISGSRPAAYALLVRHLGEPVIDHDIRSWAWRCPSCRSHYADAIYRPLNLLHDGRLFCNACNGSDAVLLAAAQRHGRECADCVWQRIAREAHAVAADAIVALDAKNTRAAVVDIKLAA